MQVPAFAIRIFLISLDPAVVRLFDAPQVAINRNFTHLTRSGPILNECNRLFTSTGLPGHSTKNRQKESVDRINKCIFTRAILAAARQIPEEWREALCKTFEE